MAALPPQHRALLDDRALAVTQSPGQWAELFTSLATPHPDIRKHHVPPRAFEVLVPLVRVLGEDVEPTAGIGVRVDLRGADAPGKTGAAHPLPTSGSVTKAEELVSWDPWLVIEAPLRNGGHLELSVVDVVRTRKLRKRSQSGKIKWKSKAKTTQRITAKLTTAKGDTIAAPAPSAATNWLRVTAKPKGSRHLVIARGKYPMVAAPPPGWQLNTVLLVIAELFRWVTPAAGDAVATGTDGAPT